MLGLYKTKIDFLSLKTILKNIPRKKNYKIGNFCHDITQRAMIGARLRTQTIKLAMQAFYRKQSQTYKLKTNLLHSFKKQSFS